jgi:hypothetical protein
MSIGGRADCKRAQTGSEDPHRREWNLTMFVFYHFIIS